MKIVALLTCSIFSVACSRGAHSTDAQVQREPPACSVARALHVTACWRAAVESGCVPPSVGPNVVVLSAGDVPVTIEGEVRCNETTLRPASRTMPPSPEWMFSFDFHATDAGWVAARGVPNHSSGAIRMCGDCLRAIRLRDGEWVEENKAFVEIAAALDSHE